MSFEAEVIPLFIGGVLVVSSFELIVGCVLLKNKKSACKKFVLHVITMLIGFAFLIRSIFANWLNVKFDIASISNSTNIGLFGIFWCVSVMLIVSCIQECLKKQIDEIV